MEAGRCSGPVRGLVLCLNMSRESESVFSGVWQHKGGLIVPNRNLFSEVGEVLWKYLVQKRKTPGYKIFI